MLPVPLGGALCFAQKNALMKAGICRYRTAIRVRISHFFTQINSFTMDPIIAILMYIITELVIL